MDRQRCTSAGAAVLIETYGIIILGWTCLLPSISSADDCGIILGTWQFFNSVSHHWLGTALVFFRRPLDVSSREKKKDEQCLYHLMFNFIRGLCIFSFIFKLQRVFSMSYFRQLKQWCCWGCLQSLSVVRHKLDAFVTNGPLFLLWAKWQRERAPPNEASIELAAISDRKQSD